MNRSRAAFTIVELVVVVTVIGILAGIVIVAYSNWRNELQTTQVRNNLSSAASAMAKGLSESQQYPANMPEDFIPSEGVGVALYESTPTKYCIDAVYLSNLSVEYYIDQSTVQRGAQSGSCAERTFSEPPAAPVNLQLIISGTTMQATWQTSATATSYSLRCGTNSTISSGVITTSVSAPVTSTTMTVTDAVPYFCEVAAVNGAGTGPYSVKQVGVPAVAVVTDPLDQPAPSGQPFTPNELLAICQSSSNAPSGYNVINASGWGSVDGTSGNDVIYRSSGFGSINGLAGNDIFCLGSITGSVEGGDGDDIFVMNSGTGSVSGGNGNDIVISLGSHTGPIDGDSGDDVIYGRVGMGSVDGGTGYDRGHIISGGMVSASSIEEWF